MTFTSIRPPKDKAIMIIVLLAALKLPYAFPFIVPGILFFRKFLVNHSLIPALTYSLASSTSLWITLYWLTSLVPIPLTMLIAIIYTASTVVAIFINFSPPNPLSPSTFLPVLPLGFISGILLAPIMYQLAPSGADMATHTYIATHIVQSNGFPASYQPMLPADDFGLSPIGFPLIAALISIVGDIPTYYTSSVLSVGAYIFLAFAIYSLLQQFFRPSISIIALFISLFINQDIMQYIGWGGNTTIAGIAMVITAISLAIELHQKNTVFNSFHILSLSSLIFGSFAIHQIPVSFTILIVPVIIMYLWLNRSNNHLNAFFKICFVTFLITIPFLLRLELPDPTTNAKIMSWQQDTSHSWQGNLQNALLTIPKYISTRIGNQMGILILVGLLIALFKSVKHAALVIGLFIFLQIGILNSKYWFLPLSQLFYPDRLVTLFTPLYAICLAYLISFMHQSLTKIVKSNLTAHLLTILVLTIIPIPPSFQNLPMTTKNNLNWYLSTARSEVMVTQNDLHALNWLAQNTSQQDIILNNYGDAGLWIPAIAYRKTILFDVTPFEYDDLDRWFASQPTPTYIYIGEKPVYPSEINHTAQQYQNNPHYELVYQSGGAKIYKIINSSIQPSHPINYL